jgi:hypothetical protein
MWTYNVTLLRDFSAKLHEKYCHMKKDISPQLEVLQTTQDGLTAADGRFNPRFGL